MGLGIKLTVADLEALSEDSRRCELIEGELQVLTQPHWSHRRVFVATDSPFG